MIDVKQIFESVILNEATDAKSVFKKIEPIVGKLGRQWSVKNFEYKPGWGSDFANGDYAVYSPHNRLINIVRVTSGKHSVVKGIDLRTNKIESTSGNAEEVYSVGGDLHFAQLKAPLSFEQPLRTYVIAAFFDHEQQKSMKQSVTSELARIIGSARPVAATRSVVEFEVTLAAPAVDQVKKCLAKLKNGSYIVPLAK